MTRLAVLAVLVAGGVATALAVGVGPVPGGDTGETANDRPAAAATPGPTSGSGVAPATATPEPRPEFAVIVDRTERCGQVCRDVTSTIENTGTEAATGTTVDTRVYVGRDTGGDVVWRGTEAIGSLGPGATFTTTTRVELSYAGAAAVRTADGWITVQTAVESDQRTVTFAESRQVA